MSALRAAFARLARRMLPRRAPPAVTPFNPVGRRVLLVNIIAASPRRHLWPDIQGGFNGR